METSTSVDPDALTNSPNSRRNQFQFSTLSFLRAPVSTLLEYSGILRPRSDHLETEGLLSSGDDSHSPLRRRLSDAGAQTSSSNSGEVSIRIIGADGGGFDESEEAAIAGVAGDGGNSGGDEDRVRVSSPLSAGGAGNGLADGDGGEGTGGGSNNGNRDTSPYQRYDIQQVARWVEQVLPFSLLLLVVFIRQHLQGSNLFGFDLRLAGFFGTLWITAVMFKSNDILRKQTALKGERKITVLIGISTVFMLQVIGVYWWYRNDDLLYPLILVPPKAVPPFWHAIFVILVNGMSLDPSFSYLLLSLVAVLPPHGTGFVSYYLHMHFLQCYSSVVLCILFVQLQLSLVHLHEISFVSDTMMRQAAMAVKCVLLMYYRNGRGHNFRRQGQMLTLVEYTLLLYRALLPTPVWYRFFLNKEYGSLFSSLTTGLYLTFKLTSVVEKVQSFFAALKALSRKDINYGSYATLEQVNATGDLCAICQEKMHAPILLRCKHIFCEDCVSEWSVSDFAAFHLNSVTLHHEIWFERERTCPLCRALVRPADLRSFGDGSTSLFFQLF
ncbi:hypothetical protein RHSIM_Rhsim09G0186900 [Rhododendron simsii]|uniref:RING-type domain-containing protein n=1 Tax=Rhododendron simsii TaxID=118357 RepID=A0A834GCT3_RHOSS|nr:hypothetical protein RHSIM_Rhsim09G0186900 [Rhododendron simsii]